MSKKLQSPTILKQTRIEAGISRSDLAYHLGVVDTTLWRWEGQHGKEKIRKHVLRAWSETLQEMIALLPEAKERGDV